MMPCGMHYAPHTRYAGCRLSAGVCMFRLRKDLAEVARCMAAVHRCGLNLASDKEYPNSENVSVYVCMQEQPRKQFGRRSRILS